MKKRMYNFCSCFIVIFLIINNVCLIAQEHQPSVSHILAELSIETKSAEISERATQKAKMTVIDILGTSIAGFNAPGVHEIRNVMLNKGGALESTVWFTSQKLPASEAAFVNSVAAHALDFDDVLRESTTHLSSITVPVAMSIGELTQASGREILDAIVVGVEVANTIGKPLKKYRTHNKFLPTSIVGGFGATAIACRLLGLSVEQTMNAFGIFYAHASGNRQALFDRTLTKRIQPAIAARAGVMAALFAETGLTGPEHIIRSEAGLFRIYGGATEVPGLSVFKREKSSWAIEKMAFKKYAACGASHSALEAALELSRDHDLEVQEIDSIELFGIFVGSGIVDVPWKASENPQVWAQFCAPYGVASIVKNQSLGPAEITTTRISEDKEVANLAKKVVIKSKEEWDGEKYPGGQTVKIYTKDGRTLTASHRQSDIFDPDGFSMQDIIRKYMSNAQFAGLYSQSRSQAMIEALLYLGGEDSIGHFIDAYLTVSQ